VARRNMLSAALWNTAATCGSVTDQCSGNICPRVSPNNK
jgi:hypothetical protein